MKELTGKKFPQYSKQQKIHTERCNYKSGLYIEGDNK